MVQSEWKRFYKMAWPWLTGMIAAAFRRPMQDDWEFRALWVNQ